MSIEELKKDVDEFDRILKEASRPRVVEALSAAKTKLEQEIVSLELKARLAAERKDNGVSGKRYMVEINEYGWDQSDKFVKLFINLDGVQNIEESNVEATFTESTMKLLVSDLNGKDYVLQINNLLEPIDVSKSYRKVKSGLVTIYMKKRNEAKKWEHLTTIEKRIKDRKDNEFNSETVNGEEALVNVMKKMYNSGDTKTKQMIAKAWIESQEKSRMEEAMK